MPVYWSEQYTCDFSPYLRHIFAVKHIYLTLYIVYVLRISPIYSVPACSRACSLRLLSVRPRGRVAVLAALAVPAVRSACLPARVCVACLLPLFALIL